VQDTRLLLGQVSNEIGFTIYGNMNVVGGCILAKVSPKLNVGVFAKNRFENERIFSRELACCPSVSSISLKLFYNLTSEKSK
jgi:hypothetical protein